MKCLLLALLTGALLLPCCAALAQDVETPGLSTDSLQIEQALEAQSEAQDISPSLPQIIPPSPTAAALGKYGDVPVGLYTGIPSISIPLYEINDGSLNLPISLNYHAGGIKVEEVASWVGLGWSLNAGGVITRQVRGLVDEYAGWARQTGPENTIERILATGGSQSANKLAVDALRGIRDTEADIYYFNFGKHSGKFFQDELGNFYVAPRQDILIESVTNGWQITTEDGTIHTFDQGETNSTQTGSFDQTVFSAWYLSKIQSPNEQHVINFSYDYARYDYVTLGRDVKYVLRGLSYFGGGITPCTPPNDNFLVSNSFYTPRLEQISFENGYIDFIALTNRCDVIGDKRLDRIEIHSTEELLSSYELSYKYFSDDGNCSHTSADNKRLVLTQLLERNSSSRKEPYIFKYNESESLPNRLSRGQDYWGYYNGKLSNTTLVPTFTYPQNGATVVSIGADRSVDETKAQAGILTQINYPTGGVTTFTYEGNTATNTGNITLPPNYETREVFLGASPGSNPLPQPYERAFTIDEPSGGARVDIFASGTTCVVGGLPPPGCDNDCQILLYRTGANAEVVQGIFANQTGSSIQLTNGTYKLAAEVDCQLDQQDFAVTLRIYEQRESEPGNSITNKSTGGLRIAQTIDSPKNGKDIVKTYRYHQENDLDVTSGSVLTDLTYEYDYFLEIGNKSGGFGACTGVMCDFLAYASTTNYPLATTSGGYTGYAFVTVEHEANGYSTHKFVSPEQAPDSPPTAFPFAPVISYEWRRGLLLEQTEYTVDRDTVSYLKNNYSSTEIQSVLGMKVGQDGFIQSDCNPGLSDAFLLANSDYELYRTETEFQYLESQTERVYSSESPSQYVERVTSFRYEPEYFQRTQSITTDSKNQTRTTNYKYATDFDGTTTYGSNLLRDNHMHSQVLEQTTTVGEGSNAVTTQKVITTYNNPSGNIVPILVNNYPTGTTEAVSTDYEYDDQGNVRQVLGQDGVPTAFIWGYDQTLPVAKVVGATFSEVEDVLSDNFHSGSGGLSDTQLRDLRRELSSAQVTTYTHDPLVGITSETDPNGRKMIYHYDDLNRLQWIESQEGHVVQKFDYQYAQP